MDGCVSAESTYGAGQGMPRRCWKTGSSVCDVSSFVAETTSGNDQRLALNSHHMSVTQIATAGSSAWQMQGDARRYTTPGGGQKMMRYRRHRSGNRDRTRGRYSAQRFRAVRRPGQIFCFPRRPMNWPKKEITVQTYLRDMRSTRTREFNDAFICKHRPEPEVHMAPSISLLLAAPKALLATRCSY